MGTAAVDAVAEVPVAARVVAMVEVGEAAVVRGRRTMF